MQMSIGKESKTGNTLTKKLTSEFIKPLSHISTLSPRYKAAKQLVIDFDKLNHKKVSPSQLNLSPKADVMSARTQLTSKQGIVEEKNSSNLTKLNTDRVKSMSGTNLPKTSPRMASKYFLRTPASAEAQNKFNTIPTPREEPGYNKTQPNVNASPAENFFARFAKVQTTATLPNPEPTHTSKQSHGPIQAFSVCTNQGLVRNYNEDRVSIVINAQKPPNKLHSDKWPNCNFLGVMDGHGGSKCAEFLKDNLHHYILKSKHFPWSPHEALKEACDEADKDFTEIALSAANENEDRRHDRSGSCAVVMLTIDDNCYICNIGDSRAVISQNGGASRFALTRDHKPNDKMEQKRIVDAGGSVYQNFPVGANGKRLDSDPSFGLLNFTVPHRITPGKLSVSRAFGDIEAKLAKFGGNPNVLISKPEVTTLKLTSEYDFIVLGCDGIFDVLSNEEVVEIVWSTVRSKKAKTLHEAMKMAVESIIREALLKKSLDNVTAIIVCLNNLGYKVKTPVEPTKESKPSLQKSLKVSQRWEYYQTEADVQRNPTAQYKQGKQSHRIHSGDKNECVTEGNDFIKPTTSPQNYGLTRNLSLEKLSFHKNFESDKKDLTSSASSGLSRFPILKTPR